MWEPLLDHDLFTRDGVLFREPLFRVEDLVRIEGAEPNDDAVRFKGDRRLRLELTCASPDLSRFNLLTVRLRNDGPKPLLVGVTLIHGSESRGRDIPDVSLSGGRALLEVGESTELLFPAEGVGSYGFPAAWTYIREIALSFAHEKTESEPGAIDIRIHGIDGEYREYPQGPRLTDVGLAHVIEPPGSSKSLLDACFAAYADGSAAAVPPPHPYPRHTAEDILGGLIMGRRLTLPIPWDANPTGELEWRHFLHRHHFLRPLIAACRETREARCAAFLRDIITNWIESNPAPVGSNGGAGPAWETLSVAWRLREWFYAIDALIPSDGLNDRTARLMLRSIWEHARSLMDHQGHPTNWLIVESSALALVGFRFPCFREAEMWRETGVDRLTGEAARQFMSDDVHFEISPLYHAICVTACLEVNETAQAVGRSLPDAFSRAVERSLEYVAALCRPDFTWPSINDSGSTGGDFTALLGWGGRVFDRPDLVWIGSKGREGAPPTRRTYVLDRAGIGVLRSSHEADAHHLILRAGPPGAGHAHADKLSLELTASGLPRLVDPGITAYAPGPLTDYYRSADAHNMLLIDRKEPSIEDSGLDARIDPACATIVVRRTRDPVILSASSRDRVPEFPDACRRTRTVVFVHRAYWIVVDQVDGHGERELTVCWQFTPSRVEVDIDTYAARVNDMRGAFEIVPLLGRPRPVVEMFTGSLSPPRGWVSIEGVDFPATQVRYSITTLLPVCLMWILYQYRESPIRPVSASRKYLNSGEIEIRVRHPFGDEDRFLFDAHGEFESLESVTETGFPIRSSRE